MGLALLVRDELHFSEEFVHRDAAGYVSDNPFNRRLRYGAPDPNWADYGELRKARLLMRAVTAHHNLVGRDGADRADRTDRNLEDLCHLPVQGPESGRSCLHEVFYDHGVIAQDGPWRGSACLCHPLSSTRGFGPCNRPLLARGGVVRGLLLVTALPLTSTKRRIAF